MNQNQMIEKRDKYLIRNYSFRVGRGVSGRGLFAMEQIPKGMCLLEYTGENVEEADQYTIRSKYLFEVGKDKMINGNIPTNLARHINHSCRPNCEADGPDGHMYISSLRKINAGEELTYNYGKEYFDEYIKPKGCLCVKCAS